MQRWSSALIATCVVVLSLSATAAPAAFAQGDTSSIDGYAESLPAPDGEKYSGEKKKDTAPPKSSGSSGTQQQAPQQEQPQQSTPSTTAPSSGSGSSEKKSEKKKSESKKKKSEKTEAEKAAEKAEREQTPEWKAARAEEARLLKERQEQENLLDRVSRGTESENASAKVDEDDESVLTSSILNPGSIVFWVLLAMIGTAVAAVRMRGRLGGGDA